MSREVPEGWSLVRLDALVAIERASFNISEINNFENVKLYSLPAFDAGAVPEQPSGSEILSNKYRIPNDCILFSKLNPRIPRVWRVKHQHQEPALGSTEFWPLTPKGKNVDLDFLANFLTSADFLNSPEITPASSTNSHQRVDRKAFESFELLLPPLPEQRRIAEILSSVDEAIAATRAVIEQTRKVTQGVLERLLTKGIGHTRFKETEIGEIPKGWEVKPVDELCVLSNGNGFRPPDWSDKGLPIIRIQNLNGSKNFNYFDGTPLDKWLINPGDLLFAWAGVRGVSFGPTIWPGPLGVLNQHIFKISCRQDVDKRWLFQTLKLITFKIEAKAHGFKDSLLHVHKKEITGQLVAVPPFAEQMEISTKAAELQLVQDLNQASLDRLLSLKSALMSELLTGRKRVTDPLPIAAE